MAIRVIKKKSRLIRKIRQIRGRESAPLGRDRGVVAIIRDVDVAGHGDGLLVKTLFFHKS